MESMTLDTLELEGIELLVVDNGEELGVGHGLTEIGASQIVNFASHLV